MSDADKKAEQAAQREWLSRRDACAEKKDVKACVRDLYETRVTELGIKTGRVRVPAPTLFTCGKEVVTACFCNELPRPAPVVNVGANIQDSALLQRAGSGAKYEGPKLVFWTKGR